MGKMYVEREAEETYSLCKLSDLSIMRRNRNNNENEEVFCFVVVQWKREKQREAKARWIQENKLRETVAEIKLHNANVRRYEYFSKYESL